MMKPVLYLHCDESHWLVLREGRSLGVVAARNVKVEDALRKARSAYPEYDVRVWAWEAPNRDWID